MFLVSRWWIAVRDFWGSRCLTYKGCTSAFHIFTLLCKTETSVFLGIGKMEKPLSDTNLYYFLKKNEAVNLNLSPQFAITVLFTYYKNKVSNCCFESILIF